MANPGGRGGGVEKKEGWSEKGRKEEKEGEEREAKKGIEGKGVDTHSGKEKGTPLVVNKTLHFCFNQK